MGDLTPRTAQSPSVYDAESAGRCRELFATTAYRSQEGGKIDDRHFLSKASKGDVRYTGLLKGRCRLYACTAFIP